MVGPIGVSAVALSQLRKHVEVVNSVPRSELEFHYRWADVLLLPTICEGSATVCYEALASGLPVITTENAGSVIRDGLDGYIVPVRDSDSIADRITRLIQTKGLLGSMSENALHRATEFTLERYTSRLLEALGASPVTSFGSNPQSLHQL
jgi:glycosyltransferase involved in cell wall biosynthesis